MRRLLRALADSLRSDSRRARLAWAFGLAAVMFAVYMSNGRTIGSGDTLPARYLMHSIVHERNMDLNEFPHLYANTGPYFAKDGLPYFITTSGDRYISAFATTAGILAVPVHLAAHLFPDPDSADSLKLQEKIGGALMTAASVIFVFLAARELASGPAALLVTVVYGLGTSAFSVSSQGLWQHGPSAWFLAWSAYLLLRGRRTGRYWAAGATLGMAVLCRPTNGIVVVILGLYVLLAHRRQILPFVLAGLPFLGFLVWQNWDYGHLLGPLSGDARPEQWQAPLLATFAKNLLNPNRGLLVFSPVMVFVAHGLWRKVVGERDWLFLGFALCVLAQMGIVSKFGHWTGGHTYGSRYWGDSLPFLALFLVPMAAVVVSGQRRVWSAAFVVLAALSIGIHSLGAYSTKARSWNGTPDVDYYPAKLNHWWDGQIMAGLRGRVEVVPFDNVQPGTGARIDDPKAKYGWAKRLDPSDSPITLACEMRPKRGVHRLTFRARAEGAETKAGEMRVLSQDGEELARLELPGSTEGYVTLRTEVTLRSKGSRRRIRCEFTSAGTATVWLDHVEMQRVGR